MKKLFNAGLYLSIVLFIGGLILHLSAKYMGLKLPENSEFAIILVFPIFLLAMFAIGIVVTKREMSFWKIIRLVHPGLLVLGVILSIYTAINFSSSTGLPLFPSHDTRWKAAAAKKISRVNNAEMFSGHFLIFSYFSMLMLLAYKKAFSDEDDEPERNEKISPFKGKEIEVVTLPTYEEFSSSFDENVSSGSFFTIGQGQFSKKVKMFGKNKNNKVKIMIKSSFRYFLKPYFKGIYEDELLRGKITSPGALSSAIFFSFCTLFIFAFIVLVTLFSDEGFNLLILLIPLTMFGFIAGMWYLSVYLFMIEVAKLEDSIRHVFSKNQK